MNKDLDADLILDLGIICQQLYIMLHQAPTKAQMETFCGCDAFSEHFEKTGNAAGQKAAARLRELCRALDGKSLARLAADYQQLFVGPGAPSVAPWGSVYLHPNKELFDLSTIEVEKCYQKYGLKLDTGMHEPADHIGLMFAFLAYLFSKMIDENYLDSSVADWRQAIADFAGNLLLPWSDHFFALMREKSETEHYQNLALLGQAVLADIAKLSGAKRKKVTLY